MHVASLQGNKKPRQVRGNSLLLNDLFSASHEDAPHHTIHNRIEALIIDNMIVSAKHFY